MIKIFYLFSWLFKNSLVFRQLFLGLGLFVLTFCHFVGTREHKESWSTPRMTDA